MTIDGFQGPAHLAADDSHMSPEEKEKLRTVARQFEAVFVNQMVGAMRKTVQPNGLMPQSQGEKIYQGMLDTEYADRLSQSNQFGLSDLIYEHLLRTSGAR
jgi:flagellar protein FlgJ